MLAPLNRSGDEEGCTLTGGEVSTPKGFKEAYKQFLRGGWQGVCRTRREYGGQGLPMSMGVVQAR